MFKNPTVFILGAGASWHYGYPTGEKLVQDVIVETKALARHYEVYGSYGQFLTKHAKSITEPSSIPAYLSSAAKRECDELVRRLKAVNPTVIDYFLGHNPTLQKIGKLIIALVILKAEADFVRTKYNANRLYDVKNSPYHEVREKGVDPKKFKDDWIRFVIYALSVDCQTTNDLLSNKVHFVTFNYDTSLERRLYEGLSAIEAFDESGIREFLSGDRVIHIYGKVGDPYDNPIEISQPVPSGDGPGAEKFVAMIDSAYKASHELLTIDPHDKEKNISLIENAKSIIAVARQIYILGYGFDPNNNRRLELGEYLSARNDVSLPTVSFTNYGDGNRVNNHASILCFRVPGTLRKGVYVRGHCEKSDRDVYHALETDFEFFQ